ncbi:MAG: hypothetical protein RR936_12885 [Carnobacterium sp.]|uniref:hypothetical protein n=1 Tax=Carnobacterium sp. TaxID=48221 RepID=UPI002FC831F2
MIPTDKEIQNSLDLGTLVEALKYNNLKFKNRLKVDSTFVIFVETNEEREVASRIKSQIEKHNKKLSDKIVISMKLI